MKIALVTSIAPFVLGGARNIVDWLAASLEAAGHETEIIGLPFDESPDRIVPQFAAYRMIDLTGQADVVVCFRPPSYAVVHPRKVLWFIHHVRTYYDLWEGEYRGMPDTALTRGLRDTIRRFDTEVLGGAARVLTNSHVVSDRLTRFNGIDSEVLYPPLFDAAGFADHGLGDEIVAVARLEPHKRQHLLVEALGLTTTAVRLRLIGKGSTPSYASDLRMRGEALGVADRLVVDDSWVEEGEKRRLIGESLASAYLPHDEDSYGYPSLEAGHSHKGVLTTTDSGGVLEFVEHERSGLVVEPTPAALASAMDRLFVDRELAARVGAGAAARIDELDISWAHVVERITAPVDGSS